MAIRLIETRTNNSNVPMRLAMGHFATNHSHINYYIDITYQKTRISEAKDSAYQLVSNFINDTPVDTILCLDGTAIIGTCGIVGTGFWLRSLALLLCTITSANCWRYTSMPKPIFGSLNRMR